WEFRDGVAVRPLLAMVLERDDLRREVEMLPAPPLPDDLAARRDLDQVVRVDRGPDLGPRKSALHAGVELRWKRAQAEQDDVAVPKFASVVVMVRMLDLPDGLAVPVDLEGGARLEARPRFEAPEVLHHLAGVEEMAGVEEIAVEARAIRQTPRVDHVAVHVDQVHGAVAEHRREERVAGEGASRIGCGGPGAGGAYAVVS